jgi:uncharacterized protein
VADSGERNEEGPLSLTDRDRIGNDRPVTSDPRGLDLLDREECLRLLRCAPVGRIVYTANALPAVQPVNYVLDGETIVIRTESRSNLAAAGRHDVVAFEVDDIDPVRGTGWSVVVTGRAREVTGSAAVARLTALPLHPWTLDGPCRFVQISCEIVTGHRLTDDGASR